MPNAGNLARADCLIVEPYRQKQLGKPSLDVRLQRAHGQQFLGCRPPLGLQAGAGQLEPPGQP